MRIELGKIKKDFVTLPKFLFNIHFKNKDHSNCFILGRLYRGYIGWIISYKRLYSELWIHYPDKELRTTGK